MIPYEFDAIIKDTKTTIETQETIKMKTPIKPENQTKNGAKIKMVPAKTMTIENHDNSITPLLFNQKPIVSAKTKTDVLGSLEQPPKLNRTFRIDHEKHEKCLKEALKITLPEGDKNDD